MTAVLEKVERSWLPISDMLRVPKTETDYDQLVVLLDELIDEIGEDESHPLASFMDVVGVLVENYETVHYPELA
jgi:HTH-type transcriptional regulator / antitoxin HigA